MSDVSNFTCLKPLPDNHPRIISINGTFPSNSDPQYEEFDKLLWILTELEGDARETPIILVIDSPGGNTAALNILLSHIKLISSPVYMIARNAGSAASILLAHGEKDYRYVFECSKVSLHNPVLRNEPSECFGHRPFPWIFKQYCELSEEEISNQDACDQLARQYARMLDKLTDGKLLVSDEEDEEKRATAMIRLLDETPTFTGQEAVQRGLADHVIREEGFRSLFIH